MAYGNCTRVFIEDSAAATANQACANRPTARLWQALDPDRRLALIEQRLRPANDLMDGFPPSL
jgi:hypothetical protein